jgi:hypothetical protein
MKIFTIALALAISMQSFGAACYVQTAANGGSDSNNGSQAAPFLTVGKAESHVTSSTNICYVGPGTFSERVTLNNTTGTTNTPLYWGHPRTL